MARKASRTMDMVNGPVWKNVWIYAVPLMLTNLLQMCFNAADTIIVGRFAGQQAGGGWRHRIAVLFSDLGL